MAPASWRKVSEEGLAGLTFFVTCLAMPALFFRLVAEAPLGHAAGFSFVLTTTFSTYCAFAIAFSVGALTNGGQITQATIQGLVGSYSNIGMLAPGWCSLPSAPPPHCRWRWSTASTTR